jgi:outer membrane lipase/esterase
MGHFKLLATALGTAILLAACGGGGDGNQASAVKFTSMVSFGDSLSDVGTYKVGTVLALGGGTYSVNGIGGALGANPTPTKNWTELVAAQLGQTAPCPAQTGLDGDAAQGFSVAVVNHAGCLNYAQGGSRVTNPYGPGNKVLGGGNATLGQLTVPIVTQISNHLATVSGSFSGKELVTMAAGANDVFINLNAVSNAFAGGATAVGAATIAGWSSGVQTTVFAGGSTATNAAITAAVTAMGTAGAELAGYVKSQIVAKGAKYVVVVNMPDVSKTPFAYGQDAGTQALINQMVTTFNTQLQTGLAGTAGVRIVDAYSDNRNQAANPASYSLTNVTTPACNLTSPTPNALGSSLVCNTSNVIAGDTSHYLFADSVHPTPYGYKLFAQLVTKELVLAGWL